MTDSWDPPPSSARGRDVWIPARPDDTDSFSHSRQQKQRRKQSQKNNQYNEYNNNNNRNNPFHRAQRGRNNFSNPPSSSSTTANVQILAKNRNSGGTFINSRMDSFDSASHHEQKRQQQRKNYLMKQEQNKEHVIMQNHNHKKQRYSDKRTQIFNQTQSQSQSPPKNNRFIPSASTSNTDNRILKRPKLFVKNYGGPTKHAILDLSGNANDEELEAELDKKTQQNVPFKPMRPPIRTPSHPAANTIHSSSFTFNHRNSSQSLSQSNEQNQADEIGNQALPIIQPKPKYLDSEQLENEQLQRHKNEHKHEPNDNVPESQQYPSGFVPHSNDIRNMSNDKNKNKTKTNNKNRKSRSSSMYSDYSGGGGVGGGGGNKYGSKHDRGYTSKRRNNRDRDNGYNEYDQYYTNNQSGYGSNYKKSNNRGSKNNYYQSRNNRNRGGGGGYDDYQRRDEYDDYYNDSNYYSSRGNRGY